MIQVEQDEEGELQIVYVEQIKKTAHSLDVEAFVNRFFWVHNFNESFLFSELL